MIRTAAKTVHVTRNRALIEVARGQSFDFTAAEIAAIEEVDPKAFRPEPPSATTAYPAEDDC